MHIQLDPEFISHSVFQPVYLMSGKLFSVELLTRFHGVAGSLVMPAGIGITLLSPEQRIELFDEQLQFAEQNALWFVENEIILTINIDETVVDWILCDWVLSNRLQQCTFIAFEISESFPNLSAGKDNNKIRLLKDSHTLWLDGFGSGKATLSALYDGLFDYVKIDKRFYWHLFAQQGYDVVMDSLLKNINILCQGVIVCGIEKKEHFTALRNAGVLGLQGFLWPMVKADTLYTLPLIAKEFDIHS